MIASRWARLAGLVAAILLALSSSGVNFAAASGLEIGVYADRFGTRTVGNPSVPLTGVFYLVAKNHDDSVPFEINAWQTKLAGAGDNPGAGLRVISAELFGPAPQNMGTIPEFDVDLGGCLTIPPHTAIPLAKITFFADQIFDGGIIFTTGLGQSLMGRFSSCAGVVSNALTAHLRIIVENPAGPPSSIHKNRMETIIGRGVVTEFISPIAAERREFGVSLVKVSVSNYFHGSGPLDFEVYSAGVIQYADDKFFNMTGFGTNFLYPIPGSEIIFVAQERLPKYWNWQPRVGPDGYLLSSFLVVGPRRGSDAESIYEQRSFGLRAAELMEDELLMASLEDSLPVSFPAEFMEQRLEYMGGSESAIVDSLISRYGDN